MTELPTDGKARRFSPYGRTGGLLIPKWLVSRKGLNPAAKFLYARMAQYTGQGRTYCWPQQTQLAEYMGVSERTIRNLLDELVNAELIEIERPRQGNPNKYHFLEHEWMLGADAGDIDSDSVDSDGPTPVPTGNICRTNSSLPADVAPLDRQDLPLSSFKKLSSNELPSAGAESHGVSPIRVDTASLKKSRPKAKPRYVEPKDESPVLGAEVKPIPIHRKDSTAGLVFQFRRLAQREIEDLGPTDLNDGALARVVRSWLQRGMEPAVILETMETYLGRSPRRNGKPLWQSFAGAAETLYIKASDRIDSETSDYSRER